MACAWALLGLTGFLVALYWLSCPGACAVLVPHPGMEPISPVLQGEFFTTGSPAKSRKLTVSLKVLRWVLENMVDLQSRHTHPGSSPHLSLEWRGKRRKTVAKSWHWVDHHPRAVEVWDTAKREHCLPHKQSGWRLQLDGRTVSLERPLHMMPEDPQLSGPPHTASCHTEGRRSLAGRPLALIADLAELTQRSRSFYLLTELWLLRINKDNIFLNEKKKV